MSNLRGTWCVLTNGLSKTPSARISSLEGINLVVRAFKKEMQKQSSPPDRWQLGCIRAEINPPEPLEGSGALQNPN